MTLPQTAQFINNLILQTSQYAIPDTPSPGSNEVKPQTRTQRCGHPRLTQAQWTSAFSTTQLAKLKPLMLTLHCIFPNEFLPALDILDRGLVRRVRRHARQQQNTLTGIGEDGGEHAAETQTEFEAAGEAAKEDIFFVTSASAISSTSRPSFPASQHPGGDHHQTQRQRQAWQEKGYEVRLQAWNCTCPSFTISAFCDIGPEPSSLPSSPSPDQTASADDTGNGGATPDRVGHDGSSADADADAGADTADTSAYPKPYSFGGTLPLHPESAPPVCKHTLACLLAALCPGLGVNGGSDGSRFVTLDREEIAALCAGWGG